jgi:5-methylcytosine-specific restriction endonuclease McrA
MNYKIFPPAALLIYKNSLIQLMDEDWLFSNFPEYLNFRISRKKLPLELFFKTIHNGFLYLLGCHFFDYSFSIIDDLITCDAKTAYIMSNNVYSLLIGSGINNNDATTNLLLAIDELDEILCEVPGSRQNSVFHRRKIHFALQDALENIEDCQKKDIDNLRNIYAKNYAERAFHDRQVCEYITYTLTRIYENQGYPVFQKEGEMNFSRIKRENWPTWVKPTLLARERNVCPNCGISFDELNGEPQIDHIVPLDKGGCNDIVNLQILCSKCNLEKLNNFKLVNSSIPQYFNWQKEWKKKTL